MNVITKKPMPKSLLMITMRLLFRWKGHHTRDAIPAKFDTLTWLR